MNLIRPSRDTFSRQVLRVQITQQIFGQSLTVVSGTSDAYGQIVQRIHGNFLHRLYGVVGVHGCQVHTFLLQLRPHRSLCLQFRQKTDLF